MYSLHICHLSWPCLPIPGKSRRCLPILNCHLLLATIVSASFSDDKSPCQLSPPVMKGFSSSSFTVLFGLFMVVSAKVEPVSN